MLPSLYAIYDIYAIYGEILRTANSCRTRLPKNGHQKSTNIHQKKYQYNLKKVPIDNGPIFTMSTYSRNVFAPWTAEAPRKKTNPF